MKYIVLNSRAVLTVGGTDRAEFLQGLISNDIKLATSSSAIWSALLTPQGKYLHDFFILHMGTSFCLDCEAQRKMNLGQRLSRYKLRSKVELGVGANLVIVALIGDAVPGTLGLYNKPGSAGAFGDGIAFVDPRLSAMGARAVLPRATAIEALQDLGFTEGNIEDYDKLRIGLGLSDGSRDLIVEKSTLLESNFEELNGLDWDKGCYIGQELTARTKYRGLGRRRLMPVKIEGPIPNPGTPIFAGKMEAGELRSAIDGVGLAFLRLDRINKSKEDGVVLVADEAQIIPLTPNWARY